MFKKKPKPETAAPEAATTDAAVDGAEGEGAPKKKGKLKLMIIAGVAAVAVLGGGAAAYFLMFAPSGEAAEPEVAVAEPTDPDAAPFGTVTNGPTGTTYYTLPDLVVNIQTGDGRPQHLKLKLTFELADPAVIEQLEPAAPRLRDMFTTFLRELRAEDLSGSQGTYQLRQELQRRVNLVIAPAQVRSVLIQEMLIQ